MLNGEYAFFTNEVTWQSREGAIGWMGDDGRDEDAVKAFTGRQIISILFLVMPYPKAAKSVNKFTVTSPAIAIQKVSNQAKPKWDGWKILLLPSQFAKVALKSNYELWWQGCVGLQNYRLEVFI